MAARVDRKPQALAKARGRNPAPKGGRGSGLTPRIRAAVGYFVFGWPGMNSETTITYDTAAEKAGIKGRAFRDALRRPAVLAYFQAEQQALRMGEGPASIRALAEVRDSAKLKDTPAGARARVAAAAELLKDPTKDGGVNIAVAVSNTVQVRAGYVIDLTEPEDELPTIDGEAERMGEEA